MDMGDRKLHWTFCTSDIKNPIKPADSGSAFAVGTDNTVVAFSDPKFSPFSYDANSKMYNGFTITYTSKAVDPVCKEKDKKS